MTSSPFNISLEEFVSLREAKRPYILLDVRDPPEIILASLPEHVNIPLKSLMEDFGRFEKDDKIITLCHYGVRSLKACLFLREQGFKDVKSLSGGIDAWSKQIDPTVPTY